MTIVDGMDDEVKELVAKFEAAQGKLEAYKQEHFPPGTVVYVECDQYKGFGVARDDSPPKQVAVMLENGNTWWYAITTVCIAPKPGHWPGWIKRMKII